MITLRARHFMSNALRVAAIVFAALANHALVNETGLHVSVELLLDAACAFAIYKLLSAFPQHRRCPACLSEDVALRGFYGARHGSYRCLNPECGHDFETN